MKIRSTIAACAASLLALTSVNADNEVRFSTHGSACQATSLGQATNFNASWSAKGIRNINTVESGKSFFVVCPVDMLGLRAMTSATPGTSYHIVDMTYQDLTTSVAECTIRRYGYNGTLIKSVVGVPANSAPSSSTSSNFITMAAAIDANDQTIDYSSDKYSVVCALNPQSTLLGVSFMAGNNTVTP